MTLDLSALDDISALIRGQDAGKGIRTVSVDVIQPDPNQPRKAFDEVALAELAASIQSVGIIQPPVVRTHDDGYLLISGERRCRAARQLGWDKIDVIVRDDLNARAQLVENIQREALSPWEIYRVVSGELDAGTTQADLARALGKSRAWVTAYAAIDKMPDNLVKALRERRITGVTDLGQLRRLQEEDPNAAAQLLGIPGPISRTMIEQARKAVSVHRGSPTAAASCSRDCIDKDTTEKPETPPSQNDTQENKALRSLSATTHTPKSIPPPQVRIRACYENACWMVDYLQQRERDGVVFIRLESEDGGACFAPIEALRLQSIETI